MYILVSVEPEGFVAIRNVSERQLILFNIGNVNCRFFTFDTPNDSFLLNYEIYYRNLVDKKEKNNQLQSSEK